MELALPSHVQKLIEDRVQSGQYRTAEDVITAALEHLEQREGAGDFDEGELDRLLAEGEASGPPLDGEQVLAELRELRERGRSKQG